MKRALCIDGGGIRGLITSQVLSNLSQEALSNVDLFCGTSTGGLIAASLALGSSPKEISEIYYEVADQVFPAYQGAFYKSKIVLSLLTRQRSLYNLDNLRQILEPYYAGIKLSDLEKALVIPAYDLEGNQGYVFRSTRDCERRDTLLLDVVLASCAAPVYFQPYSIEDKLFVDGGILANNPSTIAMSQMFKLFPQEKHKLISFSCGNMRRHNKSKTLLTQLINLSNKIFDGNSDISSYSCQTIYGKDYIRFDYTSNYDLDDTKSLNEMLDFAYKLGLYRQDELQHIENSLKEK